MKCISCSFHDTKVIDSRPTEDNHSIRRRRECLSCGKRFATLETYEVKSIYVVKKDGSKQVFDKAKLLSGILKACQKRPLKAEDVVNEIESDLQNSYLHEISSVKLGEMVLKSLREKDEVAYVRFASVYREFKDMESFMNELNHLNKNKKSSNI